MSTEDDMIAHATEEADSADTPIAKVRAACLKRGYNGILMIGKFFRRQDHDNSGTLSVEEMTNATREIGVDLSDDEMKELFTEFDATGDGVNYEEFLDALRPEMDDARKAVVMQAFAKLDTSGNGVVTTDDLKGSFNASTHPSVLDGSETEDQVLTRFLDRFEGNTTQDGQLTQKEFLDYYSGISKSIDDDEYFIDVVKRSWGLS